MTQELERAWRRFRAKYDVDPDTGCWMWNGATRRGYGVFTWRSKTVIAHRWSYEMTHGPIPEGKQLDHFHCDRPGCANPDHVRPATARENSLRSSNPPAKNARKTHCVNDHELAGDNLYVTPDGRRKCRACQRAREAAHKERQPTSGRDRQRAYRQRQRDLP